MNDDDDDDEEDEEEDDDDGDDDDDYIDDVDDVDDYHFDHDEEQRLKLDINEWCVFFLRNDDKSVGRLRRCEKRAGNINLLIPISRKLRVGWLTEFKRAKFPWKILIQDCFK